MKAGEESRPTKSIPLSSTVTEFWLGMWLRQLETTFSDSLAKATVWPCHLILDNWLRVGVIYSTLASLKREWVALHSLSHFLAERECGAGKPALTRQRMAAQQKGAEQHNRRNLARMALWNSALPPKALISDCNTRGRTPILRGATAFLGE